MTFPGQKILSARFFKFEFLRVLPVTFTFVYSISLDTFGVIEKIAPSATEDEKSEVEICLTVSQSVSHSVRWQHGKARFA